jgi:hypothetical protein
MPPLRKNKYPGCLISYWKKIPDKKVGDSISIPFSEIKPLLDGQIGHEVNVTRRSFIQFLIDCYSVEKPDHGNPSLLSRLVSFEEEENIIKIIIKGDFNKIIEMEKYRD